MGLRYENLTPEVRRLMIEEIDYDDANGRVYLGQYLSQTGQGDWLEILREAVISGTDDTLGDAIRQRGRLNTMTSRRNPSGGYSQVRVPVTAHETLAEGEFNRFYARGLCRFALAEGLERLQVYRAKLAASPRPESEQKIGLLVMPDVMLIDLRSNVGVDLAFGIPAGPNSGISLRLPIVPS